MVWAECQLAEQPAAEVLQGHQVASPTAEEPPEDESAEDERREEDETGVDGAQFQGLHRLAGLHRSERRTCRLPVEDVGDDGHMNQDEHHRPPSAPI